ncbi:MAG: GspE/PulE family protein [Candidatus Saccharibacteria bacterium]|nr:GspE/PulE family protein [Candidatus Saccharibacteria bacterium]
MDEQQLQEKHRADEENATRMRAGVLGLQYFDMRPIEQSLALFKEIMTVEEIKAERAIPLATGEQRTVPYRFGVTSQTPQSFMKRKLKFYNDQGLNAAFVLISESGYKNMLRRYDPPVTPKYDDITIAKEGDSNTINEVSNVLNNVRVDQLFDYLITQAEKLGASDIHIENMRDTIRVRMRVDGALHPVAMINRDRYRILIGELSSRAGLSVAASKPQSGSMNMDLIREDGSKFMLNLRVEVVPTLYGMDAVMRLFNFDESLLNLDLLGLDEKSRAEINEIVSHPRGLVLLVGPTGSGKSTTLYSILNALNTTDKKIITLEDPIEYSITGVAQIPVQSSDGGSFSTGLRSILRLDPDVVMVGEIRDEDTARTAIQASITGHLVMSSFHANSAVSAFTRMIDMIGFNPIFASSVRLIIAQRLLRKLVPQTRQAYAPSEAERAWIIKTLEKVPDQIKLPLINNMTLYKPVPTSEFPFGYKGRMVIMEQLIIDDKIQQFLQQSSTGFDAAKIEDLARQNGMLTMVEKATLAALRGETTLEEINRVL